MKKLAIGILSLGALAAAGVATSYYMGGRIQQALETTATTWSAEKGFTVRLLEYERGILQSQAKTLWSLALSEEDTYDVTVTHDIVHGPWPMGKAAQVVSRFLLPEDSDPQLVQAFQQKAPLEWTTTAGWSGQTAHSLHSPNVSAQLKDGSSFTWGGMKAEWTLSAQRNAAQGSMQMPVLRAKMDDGSSLEMEDTDITFDVHVPASFSFWVGPSAMKVGLVSFDNEETQTQLKLQQLAISSNAALQDKLLQMDMQTRIAKVQVPDYSLDNMALEVDFKQLDAAWLDAFMLQMQRGTEDDNPTAALLRTLPAFLATQPEIAARFGVVTPDGPAEISTRLAYAGQQPEAFNPMVDLQAHVRAKAPKVVLTQLLDSSVRSDYLELLEELDQAFDEEELQAAVDDGVGKRLKSLQELGALQDDGTTVSAEVELDQGAIKLNGKPTELQNLLQMGGAI